jgi:hypothetical protein
MKIMSAIVFALAITAVPALARTSSLSIAIPSARSSGAGIHGFAGTEDGPAVQPGTVGSAAAASTYTLSVSEQDAANIPALPGTEAGPSVKPPSHLS